MARIRTIKPDFFTHPSIVVLSVPARLLFIALWTQADDEGRLYDQPAKIRGLSFGDADKVSVDRLLEELAEHGRIVRYDAMSRDCIEVVDFDQHQRINRPTPSAIPAPGLFTKSSANGQGVLTEHSPLEGKGMEGKGKEAVLLHRFDEFWQVYPIHRDRRAAERAWVKALREERADPDTIIAGAERYRDDPNRDPAKTKYAQGWLNGDRWEDESALVPPGGSTRPTPDNGLDDSWLFEGPEQEVGDA
jgi:hypothetical protein